MHYKLNYIKYYRERERYDHTLIRRTEKISKQMLE